MILERSDLRPEQEEAAAFVRSRTACALWMDMGLGKTSSTLTALGDLFDAFEARRVLVIAPLRVARDVWSDEVQAWAHLKRIRVVHIGGTVKERIAALKRRADVWTIGRENVQWLESLFIRDGKQIRAWPWDTVILDESQSFKSQSAKRWRSLRRLRRLIPRLIQLTGTPSPNGYGDLWAQIYLLDQGQRLGRTERAYKARWFNPPPFGHFGKWTLKPGAEKEIQAALADIVFVLKDNGHGDVIYNPIRVHLPSAVAGGYRRFEKKAVADLASGRKVLAVNAAVLAGKLLQYANGALYTDDKGTYEILHNVKVEAFTEALEGIGGKALIAYEFKSDLARMKEVLAGQERTWDVLDDERSVARWRAGETDFLILHPASAGHGLNLQREGAETILWFGLTPNLEHYQQLNARLIGGHRRAGKRIVIHHLIATGTRDEDMLALLTAKGATQDDLTRRMAALAGG